MNFKDYIDKPREKLKEKGLNVLSEVELLAILLESGYKNVNVIELANNLLKKDIKNMSYNSLTSLKGIGPAKACKILACFELVKRLNSGKICEKIITCSKDVAEYYLIKMKDLKKEHLICVFLDSKNKIIKDEIISIGTLNSSLIHPREVFKEAIKNSANSIILVHNHPSGDCTASVEDKEITKQFVKAGELLNIKLLDHIVIGSDNYESLC